MSYHHPHNGMKFSTPDNDNDNEQVVTVQLNIRVDGGTIIVTH